MLSVNGEFDVASTEDRDHRHGLKQSSRKLGDPRDIQLFGVGSVGEGEMPRRDFRWASRTESFFQQIGLCSLKLLVPFGQAQRKPKTIRLASGDTVSQHKAAECCGCKFRTR